MARNLPRDVTTMMVLELIVALGLPVWLAVEEIIRLRSRRVRVVRGPRLSQRRTQVVLSRTA